MSFEIITVIVVVFAFGVLTIIANRAEKVVTEKYKEARRGQKTPGAVQPITKK